MLITAGSLIFFGLHQPGWAFGEIVLLWLSDHLKNDAGWDAVRAAQEKIATDEPLGAWVDTDDLNDVKGKNDLHDTQEGYAELGRRFAARASELIRKHEAK